MAEKKGSKKIPVFLELMVVLSFFMVAVPGVQAASGSISASNQYVMITGSSGTASISWNASGCTWTQVYVNTDNQNDVLFSQGGVSGSSTVTWIGPGQSHVFKLYAGTNREELLDTVTVIGVASNTGKIGLREQYVIIPEGQTSGAAELTYAVNGYSTGQVYVKNNGAAEQLMCQGPTGNVSIPWIQSGRTYEFNLYANDSHANLLDTVTVRGVTPKLITSEIHDDDGDGVMSLNDRYEHLHPNKFLELGVIKQVHIDSVLSGLSNNAGFDYNNDNKVQENEYEDAAFYFTGMIHNVTYEAVTGSSITANFFDKNQNSYISAGDYYEYSYSDGSIEKGRVAQAFLDSITSAGYDSNNLITKDEAANYLNGKTVHSWTVNFYGPFIFPQKNVYSMITDYNNDECVSMGERYIHYTYNGTTLTNVEKGFINQAHIDSVLNGGYDQNNDGKVQPWEYEDAAYALTGKTWKCKIMPPVIDTRTYWPTKIGSFWEYENAAHTERLSWIHIVEGRTQGGNPDVYFTKNHRDTYYSYGSISFDRMAIHWSNECLYASSTADMTNYNDAAPDNTVYLGLENTYRTEIYMENWNVRDASGGVPYQIFPVMLDVDNFNINYTQDYYDQTYHWPSGTTVPHVQNGGWEISYEWYYIKTDIGYEGPALRLIAGEPLYSIHEEWYFVRDLGMVRIEQYDPNGNLIFQVNSTKTFIQN